MAVIPQYSAGAGAQSKAPRLETPQTPRLSANQSIEALGQFAGQLARGTVDMPRYSPDHGQGEAQGVQAIGQGVSALGSVMQEIRQREAEARAIADIHEAKLAFAGESGRFAEWQASNPDPRNWTKEAEKRFTGFTEAYLGKKDISKHAQAKIKEYFSAGIQNEMVSVGVASAKATFGQAREALQADYIRAIDAKDLSSASHIAQIGFEGDYWGEDDAVRMQIKARDSIEGTQIKELRQRRDTALLYGDIEGAKRFVSEMPMDEAEKTLELAIVEKRHGYNQKIVEVEDMIAISPGDAIKALSGPEYDSVRPADKEKLLDVAYARQNEERSLTLSGIVTDIQQAGIRDPREIQDRDDFQSLSPVEQVKVMDFIRKGAQNDIAEFATLQRAVRGYEPAQDPRGFERTELQAAIALGFDGARAEELQTILGERARGQGEPLTASSRVVTDIFASLQKRFDAGELGGYRFTGDQVNRREGKNGEVFFTVADDSGTHTDRANFFSGARKERIIQLSEEDRIRFEAGKTDEKDVYQDNQNKSAAYSRFLKVQETIDRKIKAGELTEAAQIEAEIKNLLGGEMAKSLESRLQKDRRGRDLPSSNYGTISNGLFPAGSNPKTELDNLLNAAGY